MSLSMPDGTAHSYTSQVPPTHECFCHQGILIRPYPQGPIPEKNVRAREKKFRRTCLFASSHATAECPLNEHHLSLFGDRS